MQDKRLEGFLSLYCRIHFPSVCEDFIVTFNILRLSGCDKEIGVVRETADLESNASGVRNPWEAELGLPPTRAVPFGAY
jgi:hypothetical protein